jgi:phosphatidylglycerol---prolipoprotein diacylglyceryl transferase
MHPILFKIGPLAIHSYGIMLALSFILGIFIAVRLGKKRGIDENEIVNIGFIIIISSIVGARLFYVLFHLNEFQGRWLYTFWPVQRDGSVGLGGLILLGGFLTALISSTVYIIYKKLNFWKLADSIAPGIAIGIFFTRIGCYLNGCCFGKACSPALGVIFPPHSAAHSVMGSVPLYPTQLYSSFYGLLIFGILLWIDRKIRFDGLNIGIFLILYGIARFAVDFFRYYENQMFIVGGLGFNQVVSLSMLLAGLVMILYQWRTGKASYPIKS